MMLRLGSLIDDTPRRVFLFLSALCFAMLGFGLYLQHRNGINPCPMCIVQRYALILVAVCAALTSVGKSRYWHALGAFACLLAAGFGAFTAARQSWLQWYPPEFASCGRDFYGMIESFPLKRAIPMIFKGSGDCVAVDWTFLGASLANWSFIFFTLFACLALLIVWRKLRVGVARQA